MARKKKQEESSGDSAGWLTTYTDLTTLLMTFFVLLLSMATIDDNRKREALNSLVGAFGLLPSGRVPIGTTKGMDVREASPPMKPTRPLDFTMLKEITLKNNLDDQVKVQREGRKYVLSIDGRVLFEPGTQTLTPEMRTYLSILAIYLKKSSYDIEIRGHCDPYEDLSGAFGPRYLWVLSAKRAFAVSQFLQSRGIPPNRISAHGFGAYWPLVDSLRYPYLRYKNSRVEIVIGRNATIPTYLARARPRPVPFLNYKDFLFKLFPHPGRDKPQARK